MDLAGNGFQIPHPDDLVVRCSKALGYCEETEERNRAVPGGMSTGSGFKIYFLIVMN